MRGGRHHLGFGELEGDSNSVVSRETLQVALGSGTSAALPRGLNV